MVSVWEGCFAPTEHNMWFCKLACKTHTCVGLALKGLPTPKPIMIPVQNPQKPIKALSFYLILWYKVECCICDKQSME